MLIIYNNKILNIFVLLFKFRWIELVYNPRNKWEMTVSKCLRMLHPYLAFFTYRFHVEKAREAGMDLF
jgi:hypothetical protein